MVSSPRPSTLGVSIQLKTCFEPSEMELNKYIPSSSAGEPSPKENMASSNLSSSTLIDHFKVSAQIKAILLGIQAIFGENGVKTNCSEFNSGVQMASEEEIQLKDLEAKRCCLQSSERLHKKRPNKKRPAVVLPVTSNSS